MKKSLYYAIFVLAAFICFSSCKGRKGVFTPTSSGRPYEILVVVNPVLWEAPAGRALFDVLDSDVPGLPQSERSFRIMYSSPQNFDSTLKLIRNIIIVEVKDIYTKASFKYAKDVYAAPQLILTIQAPNNEELQEFVEKNGQQIIDFFTKAEMNRQMSILETRHNDNIAHMVDSIFDSRIWLPSELTSSKIGKDFFWASTNRGSGDQNFVIYSYPYTDKKSLTREFFMNKRDSVMKINIPGSKEGMYMSTDTMSVITQPINVQGKYALESRGLWRVKGDFMGGPFVSHTRIDTVNNRVVTAEVFVYSPDKLKRNLMRMLESSLYTLRLPGVNSNEVNNN